jgi:hypothetical protein
MFAMTAGTVSYKHIFRLFKTVFVDYPRVVGLYIKKQIMPHLKTILIFLKMGWGQVKSTNLQN